MHRRTSRPQAAWPAFVATLFLAYAVGEPARAQLAPGLGYMHPSGGPAGQTIEVTLGGYDWTPDMQLFVHDPRIKLEMIAPPGPVIVPEPPYWFGKKARRPPFKLPREARAKLTIPADIPPGLIAWQAANANGATAVGHFVVTDSTHRQVLEDDERSQPQALGALPVTVCGQVKHIKQVDRYTLTVPQDCLVSLDVTAKAIGSELSAVIEVYDEQGRRIADAADTAGNDTSLVFAAKANATYTLNIYDVDFRGNRAFVYRLAVRKGPRVVAAIPAVGQRGQTHDVELVGYGLATGAAKLESVTRSVSFPAKASLNAFAYRFESEAGVETIALKTSDQAQQVAASVRAATAKADAQPLTLPAAVTGVLTERWGEDRFRFAGKKGDVLAIGVRATAALNPLDVNLVIYDAEGKQLASGDDLIGSTDAALDFKVPADGEYTLLVGDTSGHSGNRAAVYQLSVAPAVPSFTLTVPELLAAPLGGKARLAIKVTRSAGFVEPINISLEGLPAGVTAPAELTVAARGRALNCELEISAKPPQPRPWCASPAKPSSAKTSCSTRPGRCWSRSRSNHRLRSTPEGKDDVTKWPRGTTFPAPVLITRDEGFAGDIMLEMTSKQGRHRQGIRGPELVVPPGVERIIYPVVLPEWLETTRTSRMRVNGVAQVKDPKGNVRYSSILQANRMGFLPGGALLKVAAEATEFSVQGGQTLAVPLVLSRARELSEPVRLELLTEPGEASLFPPSR